MRLPSLSCIPSLMGIGSVSCRLPPRLKAITSLPSCLSRWSVTFRSLAWKLNLHGAVPTFERGIGALGSACSSSAAGGTASIASGALPKSATSDASSSLLSPNWSWAGCDSKPRDRFSSSDQDALGGAGTLSSLSAVEAGCGPLLADCCGCPPAESRRDAKGCSISDLSAASHIPIDSSSLQLKSSVCRSCVLRSPSSVISVGRAGSARLRTSEKDRCAAPAESPCRLKTSLSWPMSTSTMSETCT